MNLDYRFYSKTSSTGNLHEIFLWFSLWMKWLAACWNNPMQNWLLMRGLQTKGGLISKKIKLIINIWIVWLTLIKNFLKFLSTMDLTIFPLTSANQMLIYVLRTNSSDKITKYFDSLQFNLGTTTFISFFIFSKKIASTFPCPFCDENKKNMK